MDEKRKRELAYIFLKYLVKKRGIAVTPEIKREIGNAAKEMNVPPDEAIQFAKEIYYELMEETFGKK